MLLNDQERMMNLVLRNSNGYHVPIAFRRSAFERPFGQLVDSLLEDYFAQPSKPQEPAAFAPRIDLSESDKGYQVEAELPGVRKENIKISVDGKKVSIEAEVKRAAEQKEGETEVGAERVIKKFTRSFTLPGEVDDAHAMAKLEHGVLTLTLPKKELPQARQITVQ
jgi:HSP20 family protein